MLERVFNVLPMVKHVNGEQSCQENSMFLPPFLTKIYAEVQKENEEELLGTGDCSQIGISMLQTQEETIDPVPCLTCQPCIATPSAVQTETSIIQMQP